MLGARRPPRIAVLVLAAGRSTRFGSDKRQALLPSGQRMLPAVLSTLTGVFDDVCVLSRVGDAFAPVACAEAGCQHLSCEDADLGMGHTLAEGLRWLMPRPDIDAALVALADMPAVRPDTLRALAAACVGSALEAGSDALPVAPRHRGQLGHPRILPRATWPRLLSPRGDEGARHAVDWSAARLVEVDDAGVLVDIDTRGDLAG